MVFDTDSGTTRVMIWILVVRIGPLRKNPSSKNQSGSGMAQNPISLFPRLEEPVSIRILLRGGGLFFDEAPYSSAAGAS